MGEHFLSRMSGAVDGGTGVRARAASVHSARRCCSRDRRGRSRVYPGINYRGAGPRMMKMAVGRRERNKGTGRGRQNPPGERDSGVARDDV